MTIKKLFLVMFVLFPLFFAQKVTSEEDDITELDVLIVSYKNDLSDLVSVAESTSKYGDDELNGFIKTLIANKLFDLHYNLPQVKSSKTIRLACDTDAQFLKGVRRLYGECGDLKKQDELCLELKDLDKACGLFH